MMGDIVLVVKTRGEKGEGRRETEDDGPQFLSLLPLPSTLYLLPLTLDVPRDTLGSRDREPKEMNSGAVRCDQSLCQRRKKP